jgi:hypothetical protein
MKKRRRFPWKAIFSLLLALWVFNFSIDSPDAYVGNSRGVIPRATEDLSVNDIESITELIVENFLGHAGAIPEHDESDDQSDIQKIVDYVFHTTHLTLFFSYAVDLLLVLSIHIEPGYTNFHPEISSPPPKPHCQKLFC